MKQILTAAVLALGSLALLSCGDGGVAPKKTDAAPTNAATNSAPATTSANTDADVKKLIADFAAALSKNDTAALDKIYADDYKLVMQSGEIMTKAERLDAMKAGDLKFENVAFTDVTVRPYGDTAVAIVNSDGRSTYKGKTADTKYKATFVFNKTKDGWRLVSAQLTPRADATKTDASKTDATKPDAMKTDDMKKDEPKKEDVKKEEDKK